MMSRDEGDVLGGGGGLPQGDIQHNGEEILGLSEVAPRIRKVKGTLYNCLCKAKKSGARPEDIGLPPLRHMRGSWCIRRADLEACIKTTLS